MHEFIGVTLSSITIVAVVYILLSHAGNAQVITKVGVHEYGRIASTFQGN